MGQQRTCPAHYVKVRLAEGFAAYRKQVEADEAEGGDITVEMNVEAGVMQLFYGEDECGR
ncbi:MAG: hypothetical protein LBJ12_06115 [Oscillospiraceae bacterium]|nr:hypothetical protein [Oscillospiraceae bacterium]